MSQDTIGSLTVTVTARKVDGDVRRRVLCKVPRLDEAQARWLSDNRAHRELMDFLGATFMDRVGAQEFFVQYAFVPQTLYL